MWRDPIVEELHRIRAEHAAQFHYDLHALVRYYQQEQQCSQREVVSFAKKINQEERRFPPKQAATKRDELT